MDIIGNISSELMNFIGGIFSFLTRPIGQATTVSTGIILFQAYKMFSSFHDPVAYVRKLYETADNIILKVDDNVIDKLPYLLGLRNSEIKDDIQKKLKVVLLERKQKIDELIKKIED